MRASRQVLLGLAVLVALVRAAAASTLFPPGGDAVFLNKAIPVDLFHKDTFVSVVIDRTTGNFSWAVTNGRFDDGTPRYNVENRPMYRLNGQWVPVPEEFMIGSQNHALRLSPALPVNLGMETLGGGVFGTGGNDKAPLSTKYVSGTNRPIKLAELNLGYGLIIPSIVDNWLRAFNEQTGQNLTREQLWVLLRDLRFNAENNSPLAAQFDEMLQENVQRGTCECFVAGTPVATDTGERPIEQLRAGDRVWARPPHGGKPVLKPVAHVFADPPRQLYLVRVQRGAVTEVLRTTPDHPFLVPGEGWVPAEELVVGTPLSTRSGERATVLSSMPGGDVEPVYNLEVEDLHAYFVGQAGVLVHNLCRPQQARPEGRWGRTWGALRAFANKSMGPAPAAFAIVAAGLIGHALGGEYGALGAGFVSMTLIGKYMAGGAMSWRMAGLSSGAGLLAGFAVDKLLEAEGYGLFTRTTASIGVGSLVMGGFAGYVAIQQGASLGAAAGAAGTAMLSTGLYGVLIAEGMYHAGQYAELVNANRVALSGDPNMQAAMDEISFGGRYNSWSPLTWYAYGASTYLDGDFSALKLLSPF